MRLAFGSALICAALCFCIELCGCVASTAVHSIELDDPLGLVMDVANAGNALRVYVLPASSYPCSPTTGTVTPDIPDVPAGMTPDAVVDIEATISGDMATATAPHVPTGDWTVLVRGKGTDVVSMRPNRIIATGCAAVMGLGANESRAVRITLLPHHDPSMCGDMVLSIDEQCEPPSQHDCTAMCRTQPITASSSTTPAPHRGVHVASTMGQRVALAWTSNQNDVGIHVLDADARTLSAPGAFINDATLDSYGPLTLPGSQIGGYPAVASDGRIAVAFVDLGPDAGDVKVDWFTNAPAPQSTASARTSGAGTQTNPSAAFSGGGALLVAFEDSMSATGLSGRVFAAGSTMPSGGEAFAIGTGQSGATHPIVAGSSSGFVVVFAAATDIFFQRFGPDGTPMDAMAMPVLMGSDTADVQDQPSVGANSDGSFMVAWNEHSTTNGDGAGTTIRARAFAASGTAIGAAAVVPTTTAGDQTAPTVAAADGKYVVAWASGGGVSARFLSGMGSPLPNREQPQSTADFVVAATGNAPSAAAMGLMPASWLIAYDDGTDVFARRYPR